MRDNRKRKKTVSFLGALPSSDPVSLSFPDSDQLTQAAFVEGNMVRERSDFLNLLKAESAGGVLSSSIPASVSFADSDLPELTPKQAAFLNGISKSIRLPTPPTLSTLQQCPLKDHRYKLNVLKYQVRYVSR